MDRNAMQRLLQTAIRSTIVTLLILGLVSTTGCTGCQSKDDQDKEQEQTRRQSEELANKKTKLPDFESMPPVAMPGILNDPVQMKRKNSKLRNDPIQKEIAAKRSLSLRKNYIKPGHWHDTRFQAIANHYDIEGELRTGAVATGNVGNQFVPITGTRYMPFTKRLAALPKGAWKTFDSSVYYPVRDRLYATASIRSGIHRYGGGQTGFMNIGGLRAMAADQHHLLVLTNRRDTLRYLDFAPTIQLPGTVDGGISYPASYIVIASDPAFSPPVPRQALNWTSIAYLIWDDFDPDLLDSDQQTAMIDLS